MHKDWDLLIKKAEEYGVSLNPEQLEQFKQYWQILEDYNKKVNLVSNTELNVVIVKHFIDSISIGLLKDKINMDKSCNFIDIGIGGGFPGIPILIINPLWKLCAVDSTGKKTDFIKYLGQNLGLTDRLEVITARAEDLAVKEEKRERFDLCVSRAVSQLNVLSEYCLPFVKKDGFFVAYKGRNYKEEVENAKNALLVLGGKVVASKSYILPDEDEVNRALILIKKIKPTLKNYPRKTGIPLKKPL